MSPQKNTITNILAIFFATFLSFYAHGEIGTESDIEFTMPREYVSDFPNELIAVQSLGLSFVYNDFYIPGPNGMDIEIIRQREEYSRTLPHHKLANFSSKWFLNLSSISVLKNDNADPDEVTNFGCMGEVKKASFYVDSERFVTVGYENASDLPSGTISAFTNNSILKCENSIPVIVLSNGRKLHFGESATFNVSNSTDVVTEYYLSDLSDRFGNTITYTYESYQNNIKKKLVGISRSDNVNIVLKHESVNNSTSQYVKSIEFNGRKTEYKYIVSDGKIRLEQFKDQENRETKYEYYPDAPYQLKSVLNSDGAKAEYEFYTESDEKPGNLYNLKKRTISGPGLVSRVTNFELEDRSSRSILRKSTITELATENTLLSEDIQTDYTYYYSPDQFNATNGRVHSVERFVNSKLVYSKENDWETLLVGEIGCTPRVHSSNPSHRSCKRARNNSTVITLYYSDGTDIFTTLYSDYNAYGNFRKLEEYNNFSASKKRYVKQGFQHVVDDWLLNLPTTTQISETDSNYTTVFETTYDDFEIITPPTDGSPCNCTRLLPYEEKSYGVWQKRYSSYLPNGQAEKIEFNAKVKNADGSDSNKYRYLKYSNYKYGIPQTTKMPARYGSVNEITLKQTVDNNGWVTAIEDAEGNKTEFGFDSIGRKKYINPLDSKWKDTVFTWESNGGTAKNQPVNTMSLCTLNANKTACSDTDKMTVVTTYDGLLRAKQVVSTDVTNSNSVYQEFSYDNYGNQKFTSLPSKTAGETSGVEYSYDGLLRLIKEEVSYGGEQVTSYLSGNKIKVNNFRNFDTTTTYLAYGSPTYQQAINIASPESVTTSIAVNIFGEVESINQSGPHKNTTINQTQTNLYNSAHQLCMIKRNDVGNTYFHRNSIGEVVWQAQGVSGSTCAAHGANSNQKVFFGFDNLGDRQTITYSDDSPDIKYTLDNNGDLKKLEAGSVIQNYDYNSARLLEWETLSIDSRSFKLDYGYDSLGALSSIKYPDSTVGQVDFAPNAFGQPTKATRTANNVTTNYATSASYYANGILDTFTYGNGVTHKTSLNTRNMPSEIHDYKNSTNLVKLGYTYDNQNNIKTLTDGIYSNYSLTDLDYDGLDRLTSTTGGTAIGSSSIAYDAIGNITSYSNTSSSKSSALTYTYNLTSNRLTDVSGTGSAGYDFSQTGSYDNRGNVLKNGMRTFDYNLANQMTDSDGNKYEYDGYTRRVKSTDSKGISYSMYNHRGQLLYREVDGDPISYIFLGEKLIAKDGVLPESTNNRMHTKPYGDSIETPKDEVGYTGHKFDGDLGLSYMQARYYDPVIGRFYSNDPVGFKDIYRFNRYAYAHNNPYKYTDLDGKEPVGLNFGGGFTFGGVKIAASSYILFDTKTLEIAYASSIETGIGKGESIGIFYNAVTTNEGTTVDDFAGSGISVSGSGANVSGALSIPEPIKGEWNPEAESGVLIVNGEALEGIKTSDKQIYEAGISLGIGTAEGGVTYTQGTVIKSDIINNFLNYILGEN